MLAEVSVVEWVSVSLLIAMLMLLFSIRVAVARIEARIGRHTGGSEHSSSPAPNPSQGTEAESAFEQFLAEDPQRLAMTKSEQAEAYREWRKLKGMNWTG